MIAEFLPTASVRQNSVRQAFVRQASMAQAG
jgi:hypothetical protein